MSMSTGDVRRPAVNKVSRKAVAADDASPESSEEAVSPDEPVEEPERAAPTAKRATAKSTAPSKAAPSKAAPSKAAPSKSGASGRSPGQRGSTPAARSKTAPGKAAPGKAAAGKGGGKGRKPMGPVRVAETRNWGPIMMFGGAGLVAVLIIGFGAWALWDRPDPSKWKERAAAIPGIHNYLETNADWFKVDQATGNHKNGVLTYPTSPPVGGTHNPTWQNCMGDVYGAEIPKEQATHSLEHGAVWVTYRPGLPQDQIDALKAKVDGKSFMLMSPFPGLDQPISLQAWGYQLKVDNASDSRIDDFINALRQNATQEPTVGCDRGITDTGSKPLDLQPATQSGS